MFLEDYEQQERRGCSLYDMSTDGPKISLHLNVSGQQMSVCLELLEGLLRLRSLFSEALMLPWSQGVNTHCAPDYPSEWVPRPLIEPVEKLVESIGCEVVGGSVVKPLERKKKKRMRREREMEGNRQRDKDSQ